MTVTHIYGIAWPPHSEAYDRASYPKHILRNMCRCAKKNLKSRITLDFVSTSSPLSKKKNQSLNVVIVIYLYGILSFVKTSHPASTTYLDT